ncbi:hypothetical protein ACFFJQ_17105 [Bacillus capparidis]|uniref:hypothetical protein n=1 Tax=Bacillus capparidis TaxID=1840411 RepID=UPI000AC1E155
MIKHESIGIKPMCEWFRSDPNYNRQTAIQSLKKIPRINKTTLIIVVSICTLFFRNGVK